MMKNKKKLILPALILVVVVVLIFALCATRDPEVPVVPGNTTGSPSQDKPDGTQPQTDPQIRDPELPGNTGETRPTQSQTPDQETTAPDRDPYDPGQTIPREELPVTPEDPVILDDGLLIERVDSYSGMYVEDGSGEIVSDIMMIILRNGSEEDLQLARIELTVVEEVYSFECTNLPAGEAVVLLEKDRKTAVEARPDQAQITMRAFFDSPMERSSGLLQIEGRKGMLTVTNVSQQDIDEDIYVYYKFYEAGYFYGGITFRVAVRGGLNAGESEQLIAGHYNPDSCRIVQVTHGS